MYRLNLDNRNLDVCSCCKVAENVKKIVKNQSLFKNSVKNLYLDRHNYFRKRQKEWVVTLNSWSRGVSPWAALRWILASSRAKTRRSCWSVSSSLPIFWILFNTPDATPLSSPSHNRCCTSSGWWWPVWLLAPWCPPVGGQPSSCGRCPGKIVDWTGTRSEPGWRNYGMWIDGKSGTWWSDSMVK